MLTNSGKDIRLLLIGFGPHARRIYYPLLERHADDPHLRLCASVDLLSEKDKIESYLIERRVQPVRYYYEGDIPGSDEISCQVQDFLNKIIFCHKINGVIIASEPLTHLSLAKWALAEGLSVLMDKPISTYYGVSTSVKNACKIVRDFYLLSEIYRNKKLTHPQLVFSLMAQRRYQTSFVLIKEKIRECFEKTNCPVTNVQSFHSDGQWRMPDEIVKQHYHPYNQGYGKCSHSGYHYFDLVPYILQAGLGNDKFYDNIDVFASAVRPNDVLEQFTLKDYARLFGQQHFNKHNHYSQQQFKNICREYGEIDCCSHIAFKKADAIITSASLSLSHNGYSRRNWITASGRDLYKGNGRVGHESHIFQQGPFQSLHFHSYKSDETCDNPSVKSEVGFKEHVDIYIFRNEKILGGKHIERFNIQDLIKKEEQGIKGKAKARAFYEFIAGMRGEITSEKMLSDLNDHEMGTLLMSAVYQSLCHQFYHFNPLINARINQPFPCR